MAERHMPPPLRFLLAARRSELQGLEALAATCDLVLRISALVHALQKERGYSNLTLCSPADRLEPALAGLSSDARSIIATGVSGAMPAASNWLRMSCTLATPM
jgi:hypothetical protein